MFRRRTFGKSSYTELSYIQADRYSYIDTGFVANQDTSVEVKWKNTYGWTYYDSHTFVGADNGNWKSNSICISTYANGGFNYDSSVNEGIGCYKYSTNTIYTTKLEKNNFYVNGSLIKTVTYNSFNTVNTLHIFNYNEGNGLHEASNEMIYYVKIWDNGILVRDFIPVLNASNVACFYDRVNKKYYYNMGTGTFTYGL